MSMESVYVVVDYQGTVETIPAIGDGKGTMLPLVTTDAKIANMLFDKMVSLEKTRNFKLLKFSVREELRDY